MDKKDGQREQMNHSYLHLSCWQILWINVGILKMSEPGLNWASCIGMRPSEDDGQLMPFIEVHDFT